MHQMPSRCSCGLCLYSISNRAVETLKRQGVVSSQGNGPDQREWNGMKETIMNKTDNFKNSVLPVSFEDTAIAFQHKSDRELLLAYLIFGLTKNPYLVKFLSQAAKLTLSMGLPVKPIIKATVFKQFCGGEKKEEYSRIIAKLGKAGIGTILDYSVEGTEDEVGFEGTKKELLNIIEQSKSNPNIPCTCMKMTAIGSFEIFEKITANKVLSIDEQCEWGKVKNRLEEIM